MLQLHQQQARRAGGAPADVSELLALFGLAGPSSSLGFEFTPSSKSGLKLDDGADDQLTAIQAELNAEPKGLAADDGISAAAAGAAVPLSDGSLLLIVRLPES